jgi:hypothetical protein
LPDALQVVAHAKEVSHPDTPCSWKTCFAISRPIVAISGMDVDPLRFLDMPILARLTLVEGAIHDINLTA